MDGPLKVKGDIRVELADKKDGLLAFRLQCPGSLKKYFLTDTFYVKYDEDVEGVSESILNIPAVANLAPVSWATGAGLRVKELDSTFAGSLAIINSVMKGMFPGFAFTGDVRAEKIVANGFGDRGSAQLFTGGIDSLATYARHRDEKPELISFGIYTLFDKGLQRLIFKEIEGFAQKEGVAFHRIESNMNVTFFDHARLAADFGHCLRGNSWWASIQHSMGLLGICAPLTAIRDIKMLYIASSATKDRAQGIGRPWGSHPLIDNNVAWADVKCGHDGVEWSRQEKIRHVIKPYIERTKNYPRLIVCNDTERGSVLNCGRCEKCSRTIVGLILEGIDPNLCGFNVGDRILDHIKLKLLLRPLRFTQLKTGMWRDIQSAIPDVVPDDRYGSGPFFRWLKAYEVREDSRKDKPRSQRVLEKCLKLGMI